MKLRNYVLVTAGYWVFTVTDGALRMLVLLHFNELGYSPVAIAFLFLAYEFMGILTNLLGGWVGARRGLNRTLVAGLGLQIVALVALTFESPSWERWLSVTFVMAMQALSGVAKDLTKMSSKSAVKTVAGDGSLFRLVAILTGSKNALKGVGFFVGAALLVVARLRRRAVGDGRRARRHRGRRSLVFLNEDIGKSKKKPPLRSVLSKSSAINRLSARPVLPVRVARHLVRRRAARVPRRRARLVRAGCRRVPRRLGDRLRHRAVVRAAHPRPRRTRRRRGRAATKQWALVLAARVGGDRRRSSRSTSPSPSRSSAG